MSRLVTILKISRFKRKLIRANPPPIPPRTRITNGAKPFSHDLRAMQDIQSGTHVRRRDIQLTRIEGCGASGSPKFRFGRTRKLLFRN